MHPVMMQQLTAEHVQELIAGADHGRRARRARARRSQVSRQRTLAEVPGRSRKHSTSAGTFG
jgi:hypothetical protein